MIIWDQELARWITGVCKAHYVHVAVMESNTTLGSKIIQLIKIVRFFRQVRYIIKFFIYLFNEK